MIARARGPALVLGDQAIVSGAQFLTAVMLVRELGLETFGTYSLLWLVVLLAVSLQQALIAQPAMAIAPTLKGQEQREYLGTATTLEALFTLVCAGITAIGYGLVLALWPLPALEGTLLPLVAAVTGRQLHGHVRLGFFLRGRRIEALWNDALAYGGQVIGLVLALAAGVLDLALALWIIAASGGVAAAIGLARQGAWCRDGSQVRAAARRHWRSGGWMAALLGLRFFSSNSFLVAGGALLGVGAVGAFKAAQSVIGVLHVGLLALENVVPMRAAHELARTGWTGMLSYLGRLGLRAGAALGAGAALLAWSPHWVLGLVYGADPSAEMVLALRGLCVLYLFALTIALEQIAFRTIEHTRPVFAVTVVNAVLAALCAEPVVASFGFTGMVVGMVAQQALVALLLGLLIARTPSSVRVVNRPAEAR